jgi:hypothetical protein
MTNLQKHPKSGVYRFRRAVPKDLQPVPGKTEIIETLSTKDLTEAKRKAKEVGLRIDALFEAARGGRMGITYAEAQCLVDAWKAEELRKDEEARFAAPPFNGTVPETMEMINRLSALNHRLAELKNAEDHRDYSAIEHTLANLLTRAGRVVDEQIRRSGGDLVGCRRTNVAANRYRPPSIPCTSQRQADFRDLRGMDGRKKATGEKGERMAPGLSALYRGCGCRHPR